MRKLVTIVRTVGEDDSDSEIFNRKERNGNQTNLAPLRLGARHSFPDLFFIQKFQVFLASSLLLARPSCSMVLARSS
jgi:hypothetical protein